MLFKKCFYRISDLLIQTVYHSIFKSKLIKVFFIRHFCANKTCIFILSTPRHGNLGDHAIVISQCKLFSDLGLKNNIIEFTDTEYSVCKDVLSKSVNSNDLIIIDGGGNIGTLWIEAEEAMRDIIKRFPRNPIFIMPQTAHFEDSEFGEKTLKESKEIYCNHPNLTIFCRDKTTYDLISSEFAQVHSFFVPDIVMYNSDLNYQFERKNVRLCFREDLEKTCSDEFINSISDYLQSKGFKTSNTSTVLESRINPYQRKKALRKKWSELSKSKFVVTDRLHGMIFCAITGTPCLAIDNISHKVRDGYKWLSHLPFILFCDVENDLHKKIDQLIELSNNTYHYNIEPLSPGFDTIKAQINKAINNK